MCKFKQINTCNLGLNSVLPGFSVNQLCVCVSVVRPAVERSARLVHFDSSAPVFLCLIFSRASPMRPQALQYNSIVGASISLRGAGGISWDTWSCGRSKCQGSEKWWEPSPGTSQRRNWRQVRNFLSNTRCHMVVPECVCSTALKRTEMDLSPPTPQALWSSFFYSVLTDCCFWLSGTNFLTYCLLACHNRPSDVHLSMM